MKIGCRNLLCGIIVLLMSFFSLVRPAGSMGPEEIPPELSGWKNWVLHGKEDRLCPVNYNDGDISRCTWPTRLALSMEAGGGRFEQLWQVFSETWISLPGGPGLWPDNVKVDGKAVPVVSRNEVPSIAAAAGEHRVTGGFKWSKMPEMIPIPPSSGLVGLSINGRKIESPNLDKDGRLWLEQREEKAGREDRLEVRLFRLLNDTIPMTVTTQVQLDVSGRGREIRLEKILLKDAVPLQLTSPLPARIGPAGEILLQARPGQWDLRIASRLSGPVKELGPRAGLYGTEIWSFQSQNQLQLVKIEGAHPIEPAHSAMPAEWKNFPAYLLNPGEVLVFREMRRGDPDPAPDRLALDRTWWLDFDGKGFTVHDKIAGTMSRRWSLSMQPPGMLGRVSVTGSDRLITEQGKDKEAGVELRRGSLDLEADSRYPASTRRIPAVGWDHDFQKVSGVLNLPPGWRLLTAWGVDVLPESWFQQWSLLDLFLALIIGLSFFKLRNWKWGVLALAAMVLIFHEPGAPRLVWLHLLAATALLKLLPPGRFKKLVSLWGLGAAAALIVFSVPFMVQQIRHGIYPQLEYAGIRPAYRFASAPASVAVDEAMPEYEFRSSLKRKKLEFSPSERPPESKASVLSHDPDALIQTGPGLPAWKWRTVRLTWNGPVDRDQQIRLWLLSPFANLVLAILRVILLAALIFGLVDPRTWWSAATQRLKPAAAAAMLALMLLSPNPSGAAALSGFPPADLLKELQQRLLEKPECLPYCAEAPRLDLTAKADRLQLLLEVHAAGRSAIPLPVSLKSWTPDTILLDKDAIPGLSRDGTGRLWALVPEGIHIVSLTGRTGGEDVLQIPLPMKPQAGTYTSDGWEVVGIHPDGSLDSSIQLTRLNRGRPGQALSESQKLPPFLKVERIFHLGLTWQVATRVERLTPPGDPVVISLPLLENESVTTAGIHVENRAAVIHLEPEAKTLQFASTLKATSKIRLSAPDAVPWTETWVLDAAPIWHCELSGIPVVHHQDSAGLWRPQWKPWPGETATIEVSRPKGIPGRTVTIDAADLKITPGQRFVQAGLTLTVRASRGGQHPITLPENATLQLVSVDGKSLPVSPDGQTVAIPLQPAKQKVHVEWRRPAEHSVWFRGPLVGIGGEGVNARISFQMPQNKWILLAGGPRLGPAVLFWSYLLVVILAALALGRSTVTPLKTWHWLLLGLGLTQIPPFAALLIVGWFLVLGARGRHVPECPLKFDLVQLILVAWTLAALFALYAAVERGLLGIPDMQIAGNNSSRYLLNWTQDRTGAALPRPWVVAVPLWVYRLLMLGWSLWLAVFLLKWLRWGWQCFSNGGIWKNLRIRWKKQKSKGDDSGASPAEPLQP